MSEELSNKQTWESVISDFLEQKCESDEEKYIKDFIKELENEYLKNYFGDNKLTKTKEESSIEFQRRRIQEIFNLESNIAHQDKYNEKLSEISQKYEPVFWVSEASKNASSVSFATHVSKLTHSKIDSPSIFDQIRVTKLNYLTTSALSEPEIDGAVAGNQFAPIFQFLELECNGIKLASELANEKSQALRAFSEANYLEWNKGFSKALVSSEVASHILSKQVYFPVVEEFSDQHDNYHLLSTMKSSSLAHAIFEKSGAKIFNDHQRDITDKFVKKEKYAECHAVFFPNKGKLAVTASNHSNASQLNGKRGGRLHLFLAAPPVWQSQPTPPVYQKTFFDTKLRRHIPKDDVDYLRDFLIRFDRIELSIKHPKRKQWINDWAGRIIDAVLDHAAYIQSLESGWATTEDIRLKKEHRLFLDPYNKDENFQAERKQSAWQSVVCADFVRWLNSVLTDKDNKFSPQREHTRMWQELMETSLREFDELVSMDIKAAKVKA